jgi:hypothetical protein
VEKSRIASDVGKPKRKRKPARTFVVNHLTVKSTLVLELVTQANVGIVKNWYPKHVFAKNPRRSGLVEVAFQLFETNNRINHFLAHSLVADF